MGKSPGKWIKTILFGKKGSKSNLSKGRDTSYSISEKAALVSVEEPTSVLDVHPPLISQPEPSTGAIVAEQSRLKESASSKLLGDEVIQSSAKPGGDVQRWKNLGSLKDSERVRLEQAATKAQAAFRGYLARRAFRALKGIIRLQALIRGHLVRRQAVATLYCVHTIVKLQKLVRGKRDPKCLESYNTCASTGVEKLFLNAFVRKLLSSSPLTLPLHLQYDPGEPNSALVWVNRWTISRIWEIHSQPKKIIVSKSHKKKGSLQTTEVAQTRAKRNVQKLPVANGSNKPSSGSEKPKHKPKKVSKNPVISVQEHSENGLRKVKSNLKKTFNPIEEASIPQEINNDKCIPTEASPIVPECNDESAEMVEKDGDMEVPKSTNVETNPAIDLRPKQGNEDATMADPEVIHKNGTVNSSQQKTGRRRASLPVDQDGEDHGLHSTPRVPSYMAATESAKARFRGQNASKFCQDDTENNGVTRRYSLPSSTGGQLSLSPRVQKLVVSAGKGGLRSDKSLSSSRDGNEKAVQVEWKR